MSEADLFKLSKAPVGIAAFSVMIGQRLAFYSAHVGDAGTALAKPTLLG